MKSKELSIAVTSKEMSTSLHGLGKHAEAKRWLLEALPMYQKYCPGQEQHVAEVRRLLAQVLLQEGEPKDAVSHAQEAVGIW